MALEPGSEHHSPSVIRTERRELASIEDHVCSLKFFPGTISIRSLTTVDSFNQRAPRKSHAGWWWSATNASHVTFRTSAERRALRQLDADPDVTWITRAPIRLVATGTVTVVPFVAERQDGSAVVLPPRWEGERAAAEVKLMQTFLVHVGWDTIVLPALSAAEDTNLRWLAGYRHPRNLIAGFGRELLSQAVSPSPLMQLASRIGEPEAVLPCLYHFLWSRQLIANLREPLGPHTMVRVAA